MECSWRDRGKLNVIRRMKNGEVMSNDRPSLTWNFDKPVDASMISSSENYQPAQKH